MNEQPLVAYYRVSTRAQEQSGLSLEAQQAAVRSHIETCPGRLIGEFTDIKSGRSDDRPQFQKALWLCRVYDAKLLVAHLDRMSRSVALIASLLESRVDFVAVNMPLANRFTIHILAAVAEYELSLMSERLKAAYAVARARGKKLGNLANLRARQMEGKAAAKNREYARARALQFAPLLSALRDQGATLADIAEHLTLMGVASPPNARSWSALTVRGMFDRAGLQRPALSRRRPNKLKATPILPPFLGSMNGLHF
jgi:DNA invertase Pin-like site-specific DNA recombinase